MANRLEPINMVDFTGGLNLRADQFQLEENESPEMNNVVIDPLGGIYTRKGWERWNNPDVVTETQAWDPRRAFLHQLSDGTDVIYIASAGAIYAALADGNFSVLSGVVAEATPHDADFVAWGDDLFIACGRQRRAARRRGLNAATLMVSAGASTWNDDYTAPGAHGTVIPQAELLEAHAGYLFAANITEDVGASVRPNRVRWSHPTSPTDWASQDFFDIDVGGSHITGLMSFEDHLLIFKPDGVWALYGYDLDSFQLIQKSTTIGAVSPQGITRSETVVFFYSASDRGGIYAYGGERPMEVSAQLRRALQNLVAPELVWVGWLGRKLWVTLPWTYSGPTSDNSAVFVYDPSLGSTGAWVYYTSPVGNLGPLVGGSNIDSQARPMGVLRAGECRCVVQLDARDDAADQVQLVAVLAATSSMGSGPTVGTHTASFNDPYLMTGNDPESVAAAEIIMSGMPGLEPFETYYRTPWIHAGWPTRKKSFRRPDFVCRDTGRNYFLQVRSYRDYEELNAKRQYRVEVPAGGAETRWGHFTWRRGTGEDHQGLPPDGVLWGQGNKQGALIRRGTSFGLCRSLQLRVAGATPSVQWGVNAIILKIVMRRFR